MVECSYKGCGLTLIVFSDNVFISFPTQVLQDFVNSCRKVQATIPQREISLYRKYQTHLQPVSTLAMYILPSMTSILGTVDHMHRLTSTFSIQLLGLQLSHAQAHLNSLYTRPTVGQEGCHCLVTALLGWFCPIQ